MNLSPSWWIFFQVAFVIDDKVNVASNHMPSFKSSVKLVMKTFNLHVKSLRKLSNLRSSLELAIEEWLKLIVIDSSIFSC